MSHVELTILLYLQGMSNLEDKQLRLATMIYV